MTCQEELFQGVLWRETQANTAVVQPLFGGVAFRTRECLQTSDTMAVWTEPRLSLDGK